MSIRVLKSSWFHKNWIPIAIQLCFLFAVACLPKETYVYSNFLFYLGLFSYCAVAVGFSLSDWLQSLKQLLAWKYVAFTGFAVVAVVSITSSLEALIPQGLMGMIMLPTHSPLELCLFACSTMLLAPIAEELFYHKSLILQGSSKALIATSVFSCVLYALNHALMPIGILLVSSWAIPFVISYVKTKNIYVPMTAHILLNLIINGITVIATARGFFS